MNHSKCVRHVSLAPQNAAREGDGARLLHLLNHLVETLGRIREDDTPPGAGRDSTPERWGDKEDVYLEADLPEAS
jgi:hypothetical protein